MIDRSTATPGQWDRVFSARLRLERLTELDFAEIRRMHQDPVVMAELGGVHDRARSRAYFERNLRHWADHGFGLWIVYEAAGAAPIGRAVLRHVTVDGRDEIETGYALYPAFWKRGYAIEITETCVAIAFTSMGLDSVVALTTPANAASQRVLQRTGFTCEATVTLDTTELLLFRRLRRPVTPTASASGR